MDVAQLAGEATHTSFAFPMSSSSAHGKRGRPLSTTNGRSKIALGEVQPDDRQIGEWTRERLIRMDARFCAAMQAAIERGLERRPDGESRAA
jgi:hypothetical protein